MHGLQVFTESTHIVAVRPTGNVYCYEVCPLSLLSLGFLITVSAGDPHHTSRLCQWSGRRGSHVVMCMTALSSETSSEVVHRLHDME